MIPWSAPPVPVLPGPADRAVVHLRDASGQLKESTDGPSATLYVCGITPYDSTHLGHAATYLAFDVLRRAWLDAGLQVQHASNVTDVDDPLLERATATGVDWRDLAADQTARFFQDMTALRVLPPDTYLAVSETVPQVAQVVAALLAGGAAYQVPDDDVAGPGDVYADLSVDPAFGSVAGLDGATMRALFAERGGDPDRPGKRHPLDPLLWRRERPGEPAWDAGALGRGRPGWHVECAVIAAAGLGAVVDVQGGGRDLVFPHHEMSTSHARLLGATVRVQAHAGLVSYAGHKMSKSLGNLVFVSTVLADGADPAALRLAVHAHHYRDDWEWTDDQLVTAHQRLNRWRTAVARPSAAPAEPLLAAVRAALADDLDTPTALAAVDAWASAEGTDETAPAEVSAVTDALLGIELSSFLHGH